MFVNDYFFNNIYKNVCQMVIFFAKCESCKMIKLMGGPIFVEFHIIYC